MSKIKKTEPRDNEEQEEEANKYNYTYRDMLLKFYKLYLKRYKEQFFGIQFLHVVGAILLLIPPLIMREIIDEAIPAGNVTGIFTLAGIALLVFIIQAVVEKVSIFHGHRIAQEVVRDMRDELYQHYQRLSMSFHDNKKTGELMSRIVDDLNKLQEFIHHGPEAIVQSGILLVGTVVIMLTLNVQLTLVALIFVPFLIAFSRFLMKRMHRAFRKTREAKAIMNDRLEDNLAGIKVIKAFVSEENELSRFRRTTQDHTDYRLEALRYVSILFPGSRLLNGLGILVVLAFGGYISATGVISVGTVVAFYFYLEQFRNPVLRLVHMSEDLSDTFSSLERFYDHMEKTPAIVTEISKSPQEPKLKGRVEFTNVHFSYDNEEEVLQGVSFNVEPQQTTALVGPSGAGKTTIVRLIPRLYEHQQGEITIDGRSVKDFSVRDLRSSIAMVMQDDYLFSDTVEENIAYGKPGSSREEIVEAAKAANAHDFIIDLPDGYDTKVGQRGLKLSGGQRQRVSIARAFLKNPQILILDEATSAVDLETEKLIQEAIERLTAKRTTFVIAHRLSTIVNSDLIIFIEDGKIREKGTHKELVRKRGEYFRFYEMQFEQKSEAI